MTHAVFAPPIGPEFDSFLYAPLGEDPNGKSLSVLSALSRMDVDPWVEAASLARMTHDKAVARLTSLIATLPNEPRVGVPAAAIAGELTALLPRKSQLGPTIENSPRELSTPTTFSIGLGFSAIAFLVGIAFMFWSNPTSAPTPAPPTAAASEKAPAGLTQRETGH